MNADQDPERRKHLREKERALRASRPSGAGAPPQNRSGASDQTPTTASTSTTFSSNVSKERKAISTAVTGLPIRSPLGPVRLGGQRRGGLGQGQHDRRERGRDEDRERAAATASQALRGLRRGAGETRPAMTSRTPVTPLPIAASVSATSGA